MLIIVTAEFFFPEILITPHFAFYTVTSRMNSFAFPFVDCIFHTSDHLYYSALTLCLTTTANVLSDYKKNCWPLLTSVFWNNKSNDFKSGLNFEDLTAVRGGATCSGRAAGNKRRRHNKRLHYPQNISPITRRHMPIPPDFNQLIRKLIS